MYINKEINFFHWIQNDVVINFEVPQILKNLFLDAEKADKENDYALYLNLADTIDVVSKNSYAEGLISEEQWSTITRRYEI